MFLTPEEIEDLTERKRKAEQISWLKRNRVPYLLGASGHPRVTREYISRRLGGTASNSTEPNFAALDS